ncbi:glycosyltransferase [Aquipuribacter sp. SD81]|uniref:glycosyltransferase n=1 Tax=Aquipuribacter sp. SD81 TaxID=3127703 RepID=UPI00301600BF
MATTVLVTLGTDHHRFDRLLGWFDTWLAGTEADVHLVVQHGSTPLPLGMASDPRVTAFDLVPHDDLVAAMVASDVVVVQGGPGSVMDALECGRLPIAVPRLARYREVVDDHQVAFVERMSQELMAVHVSSEPELVDVLDAAVEDPSAYAVPPRRPDLTEVSERLGDWVDLMVAERPRRGLLAWLRRRVPAPRSGSRTAV